MGVVFRIRGSNLGVVIQNLGVVFRIRSSYSELGVAIQNFIQNLGTLRIHNWEHGVKNT